MQDKKAELRKDLHDVFLDYCSSKGKRKTPSRLSNRQFIKMCRDSGIVSRRLTTQALDLAFTRKRSATINFHQFEDILIEVATRGGLLMEDLFKAIADLPANTKDRTLLDQTVEEEIVLCELTQLAQEMNTDVNSASSLQTPAGLLGSRVYEFVSATATAPKQ